MNKTPIVIRKRTTEQLAKSFRAASYQQREQMLDALNHYTDEFRRTKREQRPDAGGTALGVHRVMMVWIERAADNPPAGESVQCQRGCSHCCHLLVEIFPDEAALALLAAKEIGLTLDRERLERQAAASTLEAWRRLSHADRACAFLKDGECAIYEYRPSSCRKYMVATPPDLCDTDKHPGGEVGILSSAMAEIIHSAAHTVWGEVGMASALLQALGPEGEAAAVSPDTPALSRDP